MRAVILRGKNILTMSSNDAARDITALVKKIPRGRVATYGQIAALAGRPRHARQVGSVLKSLPDDSGVPWHRVVNAQGRVSTRGNSAVEGLQRYLLRRESVAFDESGRIDLAGFQWNPHTD